MNFAENSDQINQLIELMKYILYTYGRKKKGKKKGKEKKRGIQLTSLDHAVLDQIILDLPGQLPEKSQKR